MSRSDNRFPESDRRGVYRAIRERRDVRSQFLPDPIPPEVLVRLLQAAHQGSRPGCRPSAGGR